MKGVAITYGDIAPEAKENFEPTASEQEFDTLGNLKRYNMQLYNYASPCEFGQTLLDGSAVALPSDPNTANIGLWSKQLPEQSFDKDKPFKTPVKLTLESEGQYSSQGITFTFDTFNNVYPTKLTIQWMRVTSTGIEDLSGEVEFYPDASLYFCRNQVDNFNKLVVKFYSLNIYENRLKVEAIDFGYGTVFYGDELRNVSLSQSIDPISSEIKINTCDFTLDSHSDIVYSFQSKQPLSVSFNDKLLATVFVKSSTRKARFLWDINAEDYIGIMDSVPYVGGMYNDVSAASVMEDIFTVAKVPYSISPEFYDIQLIGYIPYTTCRAALMQVCFASLAVVNTANSDVVEVKKLEDDIKQTIPLNRIMQGQSFDDGDTVTGVELTAHTYKAISETQEAYKAEDSGTGDNILVKFSEPLHDLTISNGEIIKSGANYAYINASDDCILSGGKYEHTQQIVQHKNPVVLASEKENISQITSATLVSPANVGKVLENAYTWLTRVNAVNLKIVIGKDVERNTISAVFGSSCFGDAAYGTRVEYITTDQKDVNLGENIEAETEYLGKVSGRLISQSFNLNGNIIVKEAVLK